MSTEAKWWWWPMRTRREAWIFRCGYAIGALLTLWNVRRIFGAQP